MEGERCRWQHRLHSQQLRKGERTVGTAKIRVRNLFIHLSIALTVIDVASSSWYVGDMSRQRAESLLKQNDKEGCFVVRKSSTKGLYTLSLHTKVPQSHVKHYHIKQNARGEFYLSEKHCCETIPDLINYHRHNSGGLACRLKVSPCDRPVPPTAGLSHGNYSIYCQPQIG